MTSVLMVASEAVPYVKTGGLADVIGALPIDLRRIGVETAVVLPRYASIEASNLRRVYDDMPVWIGNTQYRTEIYADVREGVTYYFVNSPFAFGRPGIYNEAGKDYPDNHIRFAILCGAALGIVRHLFRPSVIHCHDWQAALIAPYLKTRFNMDPTFLGIKTLFTIHNLGYQGIFGPTALSEVGLDPALLRPDAMEFHGDVNLLKGGLVFSDALSTVSKGYAREIQTPEYGFGLDGVLRQRSNVLSGIVNGVDYQEWSPEADRFIAARFDAGELAGKKLCKSDLLANVGLPQENMDRPLFGIVSRFATQKGFDLLAQIREELLSENIALVALGSGEREYEEIFQSLAASHPDRVAVRIAYDNALAHKIEAGSDFFLMPSRYEPCGLNQIYSLRYGTLPIVRATGGLDDTIDPQTGFKFSDYSGYALMQAVREALAVYADSDRREQMMRAAMNKDYSWNASAQEYRALYESLTR